MQMKLIERCVVSFSFDLSTALGPSILAEQFDHLQQNCMFKGLLARIFACSFQDLVQALVQP